MTQHHWTRALLPPRWPRSAARRPARTRAAVVATLVAGTVTGVLPVTAAPAHAAVTTNQITVPAPVMGWASWNSFASSIDYATIKGQVDAMVAAGLPAAGYTYVNLDEGWWTGSRDAAGNITVDTTKWPGGMKAIADYIHGKGLKAGIYTDAGLNGCGYYYPTTQPAAPNSGSEGHYLQDLTQFENWGFDLVKVDWCGGDAEKLDPATTYAAISSALAGATAATGHPMVLSLCEWGYNQPWNWSPGTGDMWRTATDLIYWGQSASLSRAMWSFDQAQHTTAQHTGFVNDPDMLTVGMSGLTDAQSRTELSLWAISGAPLIAGNNLATMSSATSTALKNPGLIAIDQDARGLQGVLTAEDSPGLQVYTKVLSGNGRRAVLLLNRTSSAARVTARWADLGLSAAAATVRNVWAGTTTNAVSTSYATTVAAGDSVLLTVSGTEAGATTYEAEATTNTRGGSAATASCTACSGGSMVGYIGNGSANTLRFNGISASATGPAVATIAYVNGDATTRRATLVVNGQASTVVAFPPTGSWSTPGTVSVIVSLAKGSTNTVTFSGTGAWAPDLDAISVAALPGGNGTELVGAQSGRCLDVDNSSITGGIQAQLWDCTGGVNQTFRYTGSKQLVVYGHSCLDANNSGTTNGTQVIIWPCNGQANQQWNVNADGTISSVQSGLCVDAYGQGTANGTKLVLWTCNGQTNQKWSRV